MNNPTKRQLQILEFVVYFTKQSSRAPTPTEICKHFGFKSFNAALDHLYRLKQKKCVEVIYEPNWDIKITEKGYSLASGEDFEVILPAAIDVNEVKQKNNWLTRAW